MPILAFSTQITMEHAQIKPLGKIVKANAQITQLSDQKQKVVSRLPAHIENYFVKTGQHVREGDKVALVESIELSKMSAEYVALRQQAKAAKEQVETAKKLHTKGLASQSELNQNIIDLEEIFAKQNALASQLKSLGIKASGLTQATDQFILYAHSDGIVGEIFMALHSNINAEDSLMSIVNQNKYYAVAYLGLSDAMKVTSKTTGFVTVSGKKYPANFVQLLPNIDEETQRAKALFMMIDSPKNILINAFAEMEISLEPYQKAVMVKKSALTLFQGEWVVFTKAHHEDEEKLEHDEHDEHKKEDIHGHDNHDEHKKEELQKDNDTHDDHDDHDDHDEHDDHNVHKKEDIYGHDNHNEQKEEELHKDNDDHDEHEEESPYTPKVVKIIAYSGDDVAIEGLSAGEEYVSDGVYFVKSMMLKSSLGEHGH